ncbi:MAG: hypothetical protein ACFFD1_08440 [Candidatus Thorarchaeota archaeon]
MEDTEKIQHTFMLAIVFMVLQAFPGLTDLWKWIFLLVGLVILLAVLLFSIDGLAGGVVPDSIAKLISWLGVLLFVVYVVITVLANPLYLNITLP